MWLGKISGVPEDLLEEDELYGILFENACLFFEVGRLALERWAEETPYERGIWLRAARLHRVREQERQAVDLKDPLAVLAANSDIDDGDAHDCCLVDFMAQRIAEGVNNGW